MLSNIVDQVILSEGLCAAKQLRSYARVCKFFEHAARVHPDNVQPYEI